MLKLVNFMRVKHIADLAGDHHHSILETPWIGTMANEQAKRLPKAVRLSAELGAWMDERAGAKHRQPRKAHQPWN